MPEQHDNPESLTAAIQAAEQRLTELRQIRYQDVHRRIESGERQSSIGRAYGIPRMTVCRIAHAYGRV